jgi:hypothetical protein
LLGEARAGDPETEANCRDLLSRKGTTHRERADLDAIQWSNYCDVRQLPPTADAISVFARTTEFPSQLSRFSFLTRCINASNSDRSDTRLFSSETVTRYAACRFIAPELSRPALAAELDALTLTPSMKQNTLVSFDETIDLFNWLETQYKRHFTKRPDLNAAVFAKPQAAFEKAKAAVARERALLGTAIDFDVGMAQAKSSQARAVGYASGCMARLQPLYDRHLRDLFSRERVRDSLTAYRATENPVTATVVNALAVCAAGEGDVMTSNALDVLGSTGAPESPYEAAEVAAREAFLEMKAAGKPTLTDVSRFPDPAAWLGIPTRHANDVRALFGRPEHVVGTWSNKDQRTDAANGNAIYLEGQITSVADAGDRVRLEFAKNDWASHEYRCVNLKPLRISHWEVQNGARVPVYSQTCRRVPGPRKQFQPAPVLVPKWAAAGLARGVVVRFVVPLANYEGSRERRGFVAEAWTDRSKRRLVSVLGVKL